MEREDAMAAEGGGRGDGRTEGGCFEGRKPARQGGNVPPGLPQRSRRRLHSINHENIADLLFFLSNETDLL